MNEYCIGVKYAKTAKEVRICSFSFLTYFSGRELIPWNPIGLNDKTSYCQWQLGLNKIYSFVLWTPHVINLHARNGFFINGYGDVYVYSVCVIMRNSLLSLH